MLLTLLAYTVIQQIEGNLFDPLILQRILHLPPVVTIVSQILGAVLAGPLGIAVATPLAAVMQVVVKRVYREEVLGEPPEEDAAETP
jgi:predicted PurR-regulated permease PerM